MKINSFNSTSFKALVGKTDVNYFHGSGIDSAAVVHHIHPFSGEIQNEQQKQLLLNKCKAAFEGVVYNSHTPTKHSFIIENSLPFTKEEFETARRYPNAPGVSQSVKDFINSDYNATTTKHSGYYMDTYI
ncbi:MAG: hypothetical protein IJB79_08860 [Candidatus Gastranaerophilales bacterium]|nr:hypothetical protein [Candidatus Gastranaerophilales bacterium]